MAKDGGIKFSKAEGGWGKVVPPPQKNDVSSEPTIICIYYV